MPLDAVKSDTHEPLQAGVGLPFVFVELKEKAQLDACAPVHDVLREGVKTYPAHPLFALFAYVRDGNSIDACVFATLGGIMKGPATGNASAVLAALLTETLGADLTLNILQGEGMGRPSHITARTKQTSPVPVTISGTAVRTMQGTLLASATGNSAPGPLHPMKVIARPP